MHCRKEITLDAKKIYSASNHNRPLPDDATEDDRILYHAMWLVYVFNKRGIYSKDEAQRLRDDLERCWKAKVWDRYVD